MPKTSKTSNAQVSSGIAQVGNRKRIGAGRAWLAKLLGISTNKANLMDTFGYIEPTTEILESHYRFGDIAKRIVETYPQATWDKRIIVTDNDDTANEDSEFDKAWNQIVQKHKVWSVLNRLDITLGWSSYAVLHIGMQDGMDAMEPPAGVRNGPDGLLFLSVHGEFNAGLLDFETDTSDPRYGEPRTYNLRTGGTENGLTGQSVTGTGHIPTHTMKVHADRCIRAAEGLTENDILGTPRLQPVYYKLVDLMKVVGGAAEGFYIRARNPHVLTLDPDAEADDKDLEIIDDMWEKFMEGGFGSAFTTTGSVSTVSAAPADPKNAADTILKFISGATKIPQRILTGSEMGSLASTQDANNFVAAVEERRSEFAEDQILRPFVDKLIEVGILPEPMDGDYEIKWPQLGEASAKDKAQTANLAANALKNLGHTREKPMVTDQQAVELLGIEYLAEDLDEQAEEMPEENPEMPENPAEEMPDQPENPEQPENEETPDAGQEKK